MFISVLVPVFNNKQYIRECINSVLTQTYPEFELILLDDGSTDGSGKICEEFAEKDKRIRYYRKENSGAYATRLALADFAKGQYALYVDADDFLRQDALEIVVKAAEETGCDFIQFGHYVTNDSGQVISVKQGLYPHRKIFSGEELSTVYRDFLNDSRLNYIWEKLISLSLLKNAPYISLDNEKMKGNDIIQLIPLLKSAKSLLYLDAPIYYYRQSKTGMGRNFKVEYFRDSRFANEKAYEFMTKVLPEDTILEQFFWARYRKADTANVICAVHSRHYGKNELKQCFDEERASSLYQRSVQEEKSVTGNLLYKTTFFLFRHRMDDLIIFFLNLENLILNGLIRRKQIRKAKFRKEG